MRVAVRFHRSALALLAWVGLASVAEAQDLAGDRRPIEVSGAVNVNSKGISTVPALTLGRPAAIFDLAVRKGAISFEPQFRFGLDGKPWSFLLWARYRAVDAGTFRLTVGGHPAYSFRTSAREIAGVSRDVIEIRRYFAVDAMPTWTLNRRVSAGGYYLYSRGVDPGAPPHTHLVAARAYLSSDRLPGGLVAQAAPQVYYLFTNGRDGTYVSASASLGRHGSPWSISTILNTPIRSGVAGGQAFLWNVGANYTIPVR